MNTLKSSPAIHVKKHPEHSKAYSSHNPNPDHQTEAGEGAGAGRPSQDWAWLKQMAA